jgi:hypothetical protein
LNKSSHEDKVKYENIVPKSIVKLEYIYDLKDRFTKPTNCKTHSSTMSVELINLGEGQIPQNVNLELCCSRFERNDFIHLLKKDKDVFLWSYVDLKTFDTSVIEHTIPMLSK